MFVFEDHSIANQPLCVVLVDWRMLMLAPLPPHPENLHYVRKTFKKKQKKQTSQLNCTAIDSADIVMKLPCACGPGCCSRPPQGPCRKDIPSRRGLGSVRLGLSGDFSVSLGGSARLRSGDGGPSTSPHFAPLSPPPLPRARWRAYAGVRVEFHSSNRYPRQRPGDQQSEEQ